MGIIISSTSARAILLYAEIVDLICVSGTLCVPVGSRKTKCRLTNLIPTTPPILSAIPNCFLSTLR
jgi:hypothetical protein